MEARELQTLHLININLSNPEQHPNTMTNRSSLPFVLWLLLPTTIMAQGYPKLYSHQWLSNWQSLHLLDEMGGQFPLHCLKEKTNFKLPAEMMHPHQFQQENATEAIHDLLQNIFNIFGRNHSQTGWDEATVEKFLHGVHKEMMRLELFLEEEMGWENSTLRGDVSLHIKSYFKGMMDYLKGRDYSSCAWEVTRMEAKRCFLVMYRLTRKLKK
ncbi:interferon beta [Ornithorhynchus anatinus]|uniref:Interferon, beta 1, fibroblast n=1 Tax=Ornithorhynchus anatinus TaxID=9258 RepID=A8E6E1_ORNAN|nr:interferon beta [Ornithorhynchus anatinus]CAM33455.1 TPA: type I interferon 6 [Ornithorhynchus anatinus]